MDWNQFARGLKSGLEPAIQAKLARKQEEESKKLQLDYLRQLTAQKQAAEAEEYNRLYELFKKAFGGKNVYSGVDLAAVAALTKRLPTGYYLTPKEKEEAELRKKLYEKQMTALEKQMKALEKQAQYYGTRGSEDIYGLLETSRKERESQAKRDMEILKGLTSQYRIYTTGLQRVGNELVQMPWYGDKEKMAYYKKIAAKEILPKIKNIVQRWELEMPVIETQVEEPETVKYKGDKWPLSWFWGLMPNKIMMSKAEKMRKRAAEILREADEYKREPTDTQIDIFLSKPSNRILIEQEIK